MLSKNAQLAWVSSNVFEILSLYNIPNHIQILYRGNNNWNLTRTDTKESTSFIYTSYYTDKRKYEIETHHIIDEKNKEELKRVLFLLYDDFSINSGILGLILKAQGKCVLC